MEIVLALVLLLAAFGVLAYPLYQARPRVQFATAGTLNDLLAQRDGIYATLRDLDLDYQLGKLDAGDYLARRERYLARAAVVIQQLDALRGEDSTHRNLSDEIEREVAALRGRIPNGVRATKLEQSSGGAEPEAQAAAASADGPSSALRRSLNSVQDPAYCTQCGRKSQPGDHFCAKCGHALY
jgi:hypothetical protein